MAEQLCGAEEELSSSVGNVSKLAGYVRDVEVSGVVRAGRREEEFGE